VKSRIALAVHVVVWAALTGCGDGGGGGGRSRNNDLLVSESPPGEDPEVGCYDFSSVGCFAVDIANKGAPNERKIIFFAADCEASEWNQPCDGPCFRSYPIEVENGSFLPVSVW